MADPNGVHAHPRASSEHDTQSSSHGIEIKLPAGGANSERPPPIKHISAPAYQSPIRHHKRAPSRSKAVKETLNARSHYGSSDDDGASVHRINQYIIKQEIGRGSFGAVHLCEDQYGHEYAVKEFSKSRLRKRAQSNLLRKPHQRRRPPGHLSTGLGGFNSPLHRFQSDSGSQDDNALSLIKEEIAIMKKLSHNNLVALIEVLDDPQEDSLYMVLEMCKKGVVMKVGLDERAEPYDGEACRCWFRDMILGIEYLHAQGIIHRDIKPDNCLITEDDELKIVDFGVSEMFEKDADMATAKSAGSPAFMPPELCVAKHGQVSGKAADIWSMGVTLYCLRYGRIPFEKTNMLDLYESIREDGLDLEAEQDRNFEDMMHRILEKDPDKRITMEELRIHPWVTKNGSDPLLSSEENCADLVEPPTDAEMAHAITSNMAHLMIVMKAVKRFKKLIFQGRSQFTDGILSLGRRSQPPQSIEYEGDGDRRPRSTEAHDRKPLERQLTVDGVHRDVPVNDQMQALPVDMDEMTMEPALEAPGGEGGLPPVLPNHRSDGESEAHFKQRQESMEHHPQSPNARSVQTRHRTFPTDEYAKGHAHDPLRDTLFLDIGASADSTEVPLDGEPHLVSESPGAVEMDIYETAYQDKMQEILQRDGRSVSLLLNRRVEHRDDLRSHPNILDHSRQKLSEARSSAAGKLAGLGQKSGGGFAGLVAKAKEQQAAGESSASDRDGGDAMEGTS